MHMKTTDKIVSMEMSSGRLDDGDCDDEVAADTVGF